MRDVWNDAVIAEIADLMIYQSIVRPEYARLNMISGVEYVCIDPEYATLTPNFDGPIVVSMGGSDPHDIATQVVTALAGIQREIIVINGAAACPVSDESVRVVHAPPSLKPYLSGASLLIGALGMTAYEAAAAGVPSLLTSWTPDHLRTAHKLENEGVSFSLGRWDQFDGEALRFMVDRLLNDGDEWLKMSDRGKELVDGQGVKRVADLLVNLFKVEA